MAACMRAALCILFMQAVGAAPFTAPFSEALTSGVNACPCLPGSSATGPSACASGQCRNKCCGICACVDGTCTTDCSGKWCPATHPCGSANATCRLCQPGFISPDGCSVPCSSCPAGTIAPSPGATSCSACPPNTFSGPGASACQACRIGYCSPAGASQCSPCLNTTNVTASFYAHSESGELCNGTLTYVQTWLPGICSWVSLPPNFVSSAPVILRTCNESVAYYDIFAPGDTACAQSPDGSATWKTGCFANDASGGTVSFVASPS